MKIFLNNKVYVQKCDFMFFFKHLQGYSLPESVSDKVFGDVFIISDDTKNDFIEFDTDEEIEFFRNCDWIINYNEFENATPEDIMEYAEKIYVERDRVSELFNGKIVFFNQSDYCKKLNEYEIMGFQIYTLNKLAQLKKGNISFELPEKIIEKEEQISEKGSIIDRILDAYYSRKVNNILKKLK